MSMPFIKNTSFGISLM